MHVLPLEVVEQQAAVRVVLREVDSLAREEVEDDFAPQRAEVARYDQVIVAGGGARLAQEGGERVVRGGRHGRAHVVRHR